MSIPIYDKTVYIVANTLDITSNVDHSPTKGHGQIGSQAMTRPAGKLSHQIALLCTTLVLITSLAVLACSWWLNSRYTNNHIQGTVNRAIKVFQQSSHARTRLLETSAELLFADLGFNEAISNNNRTAIARALETNADRLNADLVLITNRNGDITASNSVNSFDTSALANAVKSMRDTAGETVFFAIEKRLYQVVALPIKTPHPIAFAIMGSEINTEINEKLKGLTGIEISFYNSDMLLASSTRASNKNNDDALHSKQRRWGFWLQPKYNNTDKDITAIGSQKLHAVFSYDLDPIYKNFDRLLLMTILLATIISILALIASVILANRIRVPLASLVTAVRKAAQGNYDTSITPKGASSEVETLISAFGHMGQEIQQRERHTLYQAQHDLLTGLDNRDSLLFKVDEAIARQSPFLLLGLHLRDLHGINDNLGFDTGDHCLQTIAERLKAYLKDRGAIHGRVGADLFLSVIPINEMPMTEGTLARLQEHLQKAIKFHLLNLNIRLNLGVCRYPEDGTTGKTLVRRTQIAVDSAQKENNAIRFYEKGEDEAHLERLAIIENLKIALTSDDDQLCMYYQPKENLKTGEIEKLEALIRWQRPGSGFVSPDLFIDLAERAGLIIELTQWVFNTVFAQLALWQQQGINIQVAINISAQDLNHPDFFKALQDCASRHTIQPKWVTIELTERDLMSNETQSIALMQQLRNAGYTLSVDDYGIGQSSLGKLKQLPAHELKIDKSFILKLDQSPTDQMIVRSTIDLGHNLGLNVVAEGVESLESLQLLRDMNCDFIQGCYLAKPLSASDVKTWLDERKSNPKQN